MNINTLAKRKFQRRRGQAQTEYIIVCALTFFASLVSVTGIDINSAAPRVDNLDSGVDTSDVQTQMIRRSLTIPGLKDALYVYQDVLFRWVSEAEPTRMWLQI